MSFLERLAVPIAIVIGAAIIALGIVGAALVAPYRLQPVSAAMWRLNTVTGEARYCMMNASFGLNCR